MKKKTYTLNQDERDDLANGISGFLETRNEVLFAFLYGSFTEGLPFHDIDLGVYVSEITKERATDCGITLSQTLSKALKIPVDVRVLNFAPVSFLYHVIRGTLIFERDEEIRTQVVERTIQRYLDLRPLIQQGVKEAFGG